MGARLRSWWQQTRKPLVVTGFIAALLVVALISLEIIFYGTGFVGKTLWDWLQLLIIPAVLAVAGYVINLTISRSEQEATKQRAQSEQEAAEKRAKTEYEIALDNQRETALQEYIDKMSELMLHEDLLGSDQEKEIRKIARVRTLTVLPRLDGKRKRNVLQFLYESGLIKRDKIIIDLGGADLSEASLDGMYLGEANLVGAILGKANLRKADLRSANLVGAKLTGAYLRFAFLGDADLRGADLSKANLRAANLGAAKLSGSYLLEANLSGAYLRKANLSGAILVAADLSNSNLMEADLGLTELEGANLRGAYLSDAGLLGANLASRNITVEKLEKQAKSLKGAIMPDGSIHP